MKKTKLKIGDQIYISDDDDSGNYEIKRIDLARGNCWLYGEIDGRDVEQELPLLWVEEIFEGQFPEEWESRPITPIRLQKKK